jgi:nucleotide-binding universal stress UspA family protein
MSTRTGPVIVVGVDGSPAAAAALTWAIKEATRQHGTVHAVSVRRAPELMPATSFALEPHGLRAPDRGEAASAERLHELIEQAKAGVEDPVDVLAITVVGDPEVELAKAAADADMLVVGGHGQGPLAEVFLGSVAAGAVRHAPCPVVVIPNQIVQQ